MKYLYAMLLLCVFVFQQCGSPGSSAPVNEFYSAEDFTKAKKIDTHVHIQNTDSFFFEQARLDNFQLLNINVDAPGSVRPIDEQRDITRSLVKKYHSRMEFASTFGVNNYNDPGWEAATLTRLQQSFDEGAVAVKIWKNVGMDLRDKNGKLVFIDNPRFDTILNFIEKNGITLVGHFGEPKNCWQPIDSMSVNDYKYYYREHPEYHMYLHPGITTYEEQIAARDHMLEKHPHLRFIGAHLGSLEWSLDELAKHLDHFPNMAVDMAERISHLQLESQKDWKRTRDFCIKYGNRLIYATDIIVDSTMTPDELKKHAHDIWFTHWRFFATADSITSSSVNGPFKGLHLPREIVDNIFYGNARKWLPKGFNN